MILITYISHSIESTKRFQLVEAIHQVLMLIAIKDISRTKYVLLNILPCIPKRNFHKTIDELQHKLATINLTHALQPPIKDKMKKTKNTVAFALALRSI